VFIGAINRYMRAVPQQVAREEWQGLPVYVARKGENPFPGVQGQLRLGRRISSLATSPRPTSISDAGSAAVVNRPAGVS